MSHIVVYQADDGSSGFEQCDSLEDAIIVAERMRNVDGVETPRIFRMEEIHIDFRPYYRVQVADGDEAAEDTEPPVTGSALDDLPAPPSPEAVAAAEAELGEVMSTDEPTWAEPHETDDAEPATPDTSFEATDAGFHSLDDATDTGGGDDAGVPQHAAAEVEDTTGDDDGGDDGDDAESSDDDDAMISVRRGLFGR